VDIRADSDQVRDAALAAVLAASGRIATQRNVEIQWRKVLTWDPSLRSANAAVVG